MADRDQHQPLPGVHGVADIAGDLAHDGQQHEDLPGPVPGQLRAGDIVGFEFEQG